jgi:hypothetical protein
MRPRPRQAMRRLGSRPGPTYKWNHNDIFDKMLQAPAVLDGKARVSIFVAMTATAEQEPVPPWMMAKGLTWRDAKKNRVHVRMDLEEGWRWMADFLVTLVRRYGRRWDIANVVIGEYYIAPNPRQTSTSPLTERTRRRCGRTLSPTLQRTRPVTE